MDRRRRPDFIAAHISATARRSGAETRSLVSSLVGGSWPGGADDRSEPAAREWVRRWRPGRIGVATPTCSCREGRCAVCN